jgi:hypothetical protein
MIFVHLKAHLSVEVARDVIEVEISFEVPFYCTPAVSSLIVFLVAAIKLFLYTICTVSFSMFPSYSSFSLRSYTVTVQCFTTSIYDLMKLLFIMYI